MSLKPFRPVLVAMAFSLFMFSAQSARGACVQIYDATLYTNKPALEKFGIRPIVVANTLHWWRSGESTDNLPSTNAPENWARTFSKGTSAADDTPVVIDLEHWPTSGSAADVNRSISRMQELVSRLRASGLRAPLGFYGLLPNRDYWRAIATPDSSRYQSWQQENDMTAQIGNFVNIIFPSLYTFYDDQAHWKVYASANLREARRLAGGKPVYAFLWPQFHDSNKNLKNQFLSPDFWKLELETTAQYADGIIIWGGWNSRPMNWDDNAPWWITTKKFLESNDRLCLRDAAPDTVTKLSVH